MTATAPESTEQEQDTETKDDRLTIDLERAVVTTLAGVFNELEASLAEFEETATRGEGGELDGAAPIGFTYADAKHTLEMVNAVERTIRQLGQRYREDVEAAIADAAARAQEPFTGKERSMVRTAIAGYADDLTKEGKKLQGMNREAEARSLLNDAAVLTDRIQPLFSDQLHLSGDNGPLFAGGEPMATKAPAKAESDEDGEGTES